MIAPSADLGQSLEPSEAIAPTANFSIIEYDAPMPEFDDPDWLNSGAEKEAGKIRDRAEKGQGKFFEWASKFIPAENVKEPSVIEINHLLGSINSRDIFFESGPRPYKSKSSIHSFSSLLLEGWKAIWKGAFRTETSDEPQNEPKQKAKKNTKTYTDGVGSERLSKLRADALAFLNADFRPCGYSHEDVGTVMAIANILLFQRANAYDCFEWEESMPGSKCDRHVTVANRFDVQLMVEDVVSLHMPLNGICTLLASEWSTLHVRTRRATVRRILQEMRDAGLIDYYSDFEHGIRAQPMVFTRIDVPALMVLHEQAEAKLVEGFTVLYTRDEPGLSYEFMGGEGDRYIPTHMGNSARLLFNAFFPGAGYRREHHDEQPETWEETYRVRADERRRTRADISERFLKLDLDLDEVVYHAGDRSPKANWLRREWQRMLDRYKWLDEILARYKGHPERFERQPAMEVDRIREIWYRITELWEVRSGNSITVPNGDVVTFDEFVDDAFKYATYHAGILGAEMFFDEFA
jgi:hypothetical protein